MNLSHQAPLTKIKLMIIGAVSLTMVNCTSYASFIETLNSRQVNSCVEGNVIVGGLMNSGMLHVYTATGGQLVGECIQHFKGISVIK